MSHASERIRRVNEAVREILAAELPTLKDPRIGFVTITDVRATTDLKSAQVFYTVLPDDEDTLVRTAEGLRSAAPLLRRELGGQLGTRNTPVLDFVHDPVPARGRRIEELIAEEHRRGAPDGDR